MPGVQSSVTHGENVVHQDQRIGLALAVLLLGAAGAFFFRNDPTPAGSPKLKSAREVDARIAEKSISPYLQNKDEDVETRTAARSISDRARITGVQSGHSLPSLDTPDFLSDNDPFQGGSAVQELSPIPVPDAGEGWTPGGALTERTAKPVATERVHVVQKGETLSSIAAKELGSSGRFQEVFEANRDQLQDANDVRVGMNLRIPAKRVSRADSSRDRGEPSAPPLLPGDSEREFGEMPTIGVDPDRSVRGTNDPSPAKKRFEPAKRPPLGVKASGIQSSEVDPPAKPVRKMSQLPPKEAGGKIAR